MKILFKSNPLDKTLEEYINIEGIGWESNYDSYAWYEDGTWTTAWSGFTYRVLKEKENFWIWEYEGAKNGFLKQDLLPPIKNATVMRVAGTYGKYFGADALDKYNECKNQPGVKKFASIYEAMENIGIVDDGWRNRQNFIADIFSCYFKKGLELKKPMYMTSKILRKLYSNLLQFSPCSQNMVWRGFQHGWFNPIRSKREISFAEFCYIVKKYIKNEELVPWTWGPDDILVTFNDELWRREARSAVTGKLSKKVSPNTWRVDKFSSDEPEKVIRVAGFNPVFVR